MSRLMSDLRWSDQLKDSRSRYRTIFPLLVRAVCRQAQGGQTGSQSVVSAADASRLPVDVNQFWFNGLFLRNQTHTQ